MLLARSIVILALLAFCMGIGPSASADERAEQQDVPGQGASAPGEQGEGADADTQIRPASQTVSDRQRERRRARRDRTRRRLGGTADILPHFADYTLHEAGFATTRFKRGSGTLTIELVNDCGDWTLQEKLDLDLVDQEDQVQNSSLLYRASEVRSAGRFVFAYSRQHLEERDDFIGDVLPVDDGYIARFQEPEIADAFLPADLVFPITHFRQILADARRQRSSSETTVFDGGNSFPYRAVTTISQPLRDDDRNPRVVAARTELDLQTSDRLPEGRHWPVRIDYFPLDDAFAPPVFIREFLMHESGIVLGFHFDYGDIQLDARLKHLDIREPRPCSN